MKPGDFARYGAGLAFNTAYNYLKPNSQEPIGSQIQLYRNMKFYMKRKQASRTRTVVKKRRKTRGGGGGGGILGPPIPRPVKPKGPSIYDLFGSRGQDESYRATSRPSIQYLGFTSYRVNRKTDPNNSVSGSLTYHVAAALLRHILKKEFNADFMRHSQPIDLTHSTLNLTNYKPKILFISRLKQISSVDTFSVPFTLDLVSYTTFKAAAVALAENVIGSIDYGGSLSVYGNDWAQRLLYGYVVVQPDAGSTAANVYANYGQVKRLDDCYVKCYSYAEMAIQNTTVADGAAADGQFLDNRIDANPLQCRMFKFSNPRPEIREYMPAIPVTSQQLFSSVGTGLTLTADTQSVNAFRLTYDQNGDGVFSANDAVLPIGDFDQLPPASKFRGCVGVSNFKLAPGEIRKFTLKFKYDGLLSRYMQGQGIVYTTGSNRDNAGAFGTSCMIVAEKVMSTGSNTDVSLNYQMSYYAGAVIKKSKMNVMLPYDKDGTYTGAVDQSLVPS